MYSYICIVYVYIQYICVCLCVCICHRNNVYRLQCWENHNYIIKCFLDISTWKLTICFGLFYYSFRQCLATKYYMFGSWSNAGLCIMWCSFVCFCSQQRGLYCCQRICSDLYLTPNLMTVKPQFREILFYKTSDALNKLCI